MFKTPYRLTERFRLDGSENSGLKILAIFDQKAIFAQKNSDPNFPKSNMAVGSKKQGVVVASYKQNLSINTKLCKYHNR